MFLMVCALCASKFARKGAIVGVSRRFRGASRAGAGSETAFQGCPIPPPVGRLGSPCGVVMRGAVRHTITLWKVGGGGGSSFSKTHGGPYKLISLDYETTTRIFGFLLPLPPPHGETT